LLLWWLRNWHTWAVIIIPAVANRATALYTPAAV
jgi:hypothetical protein